MDMRKAGKARLFLAVPELRESAWMSGDLVFMKLCEEYKRACLRRDALRCSVRSDDSALIVTEQQCHDLEAATIDYVRAHVSFPGLV
nr:hypothetical protein [Sinorhizobium fredii]